MRMKLCGYAGCTALCSGYYCPEHAAQKARERERSPAFARAMRFADYHNAEWRRLSLKLKNRYRQCQRCGTPGRTGLHVHHIVPVREDPSRFLDESNLVVLCEDCHRRETQKEIAGRGRVKK